MPLSDKLDRAEYTITEKPQCFSCKHYDEGTQNCNAYPDGIPEEIFDNTIDHMKPYHGDNGIRYAGK